MPITYRRATAADTEALARCWCVCFDRSDDGLTPVIFPPHLQEDGGWPSVEAQLPWRTWWKGLGIVRANALPTVAVDTGDHGSDDGGGGGDTIVGFSLWLGPTAGMPPEPDDSPASVLRRNPVVTDNMDRAALVAGLPAMTQAAERVFGPKGLSEVWCELRRTCPK